MNPQHPPSPPGPGGPPIADFGTDHETGIDTHGEPVSSTPGEPANGAVAAVVPDDLAAVLAEIVPPGGSFGHREHVHLAFVAIQRYGPQRAPGVVSGWIKHIAAYHHAPQKYHATVTRAWVEIVAHHMADAPPGTDFATFADRYPPLLDKRLLNRHYTSRALASPAAKTGWLDPDLAAFPWRPAQNASDLPR